MPSVFWGIVAWGALVWVLYGCPGPSHPRHTIREQIVIDTTIAAWKEAGMRFEDGCTENINRYKIRPELPRDGKIQGQISVEHGAIFLKPDWPTRALVHEVFHLLHSCSLKLFKADLNHLSPFWRTPGMPFPQDKSLEAQVTRVVESVAGE